MSLVSLAEECPESWGEINSKGGMLGCELAVDAVSCLAGVEVTTGGPAISWAAIKSFMACLESSGRAITSAGILPKCGFVLEFISSSIFLPALA